MHLWPSMRLRDSFKIAYLNKLEKNLHRMNSEKKHQQQQDSEGNDSNNNCQQKLLSDNNNNSQLKNTSKSGKFIGICRELLLIFSCCYCCFCCGACVEDEEN